MAEDIAEAAALSSYHIKATPFFLTSYERVDDKGGVAHLYICLLYTSDAADE